MNRTSQTGIHEKQMEYNVGEIIRILCIVYIKVRWSRGKCGAMMQPQSQPYLTMQGVPGPKCPWDINILRVQR